METKIQKSDKNYQNLISLIPIGDKRPIAKFYRCYLDDINRGLGEEKARGINYEQFKAANRISSNYRFSVSSKSSSLITLSPDNNGKIDLKSFENKISAMHEHVTTISKLAKKSREIIEHFCINEQTLRSFELKQIPVWVKGAASSRLREALDELAGVYKGQRK